jgi:hypothetical protein
MPRPHLYDVTSIAELPQQREDHLSLIDIFGYVPHPSRGAGRLCLEFSNPNTEKCSGCVRDYRLVPWSSPSGALDL